MSFGRRSRIDGRPKNIEDSWESGSRSSASSSRSSGRNPVVIAAKAISSCFRPPSPSDFYSRDTNPHYRSIGQGRIYSGSNCAASIEAGSTKLTLVDITKATKNFSPSQIIGEGGSATVYKAYLRDGMVVAVKRAKKYGCDNRLRAEFQNEIQTLTQIEHLNLVRLYGYLEHEDERILVIEYVPNGTLREHLDCERGKVLDLAMRLDVAIDVAHAITYLHLYSDHPIIHRDIKSSNILLTDNLRAKVADFGFARFFMTEPDATHVSTQVKGTAGYLDPEYLRTYQLTEKSDVYSFGVLLVELVSGRRPIETRKQLKERVTANWAMKKFNEGNGIEILDPNLQSSLATNLAVEKLLGLALVCLAATKKDRPSMQRCAEILWTIRRDYREFISSHPLSRSSRPKNC